MASSPAPPTHIAHTLLARAHSPDTASQQFTERIKQKPLFLRPTSPSAADNRSRRRHQRLRKKEYFLKHQRPQPLSARKKRSSGLYDLPKEECKHAIFQGLHALWVRYMQEILDLKVSGRSGLVTPASHGAKLVSADYHGAEVEVVRSQCASRVGVKGIVVRDTKFTFVIVTEKDEVKTIPKEHTVFRFTVPLPGGAEAEAEGKGDSQEKSIPESSKPLVFELHGSQFENRPVDRANKKFKWRNIDYV
ncbi:ribonuclease P complex subunit Pop4 [Penicillium brasilianum]|uniref:Ribonuclease P protein subunit n=1 Tax=Penicillium brasilianum TaxID=104259 RepID=A0A1S9RCT7_PENBI|nr:ribonuclease P complex subunit Pop4 [Penicillium brasilianum]